MRIAVQVATLLEDYRQTDIRTCNIKKPKQKYKLGTTVDLQWLKHLWNHENMLDTRVI